MKTETAGKAEKGWTREITGLIEGVDELWELVKEGTKFLESERNAWVIAGPELGNLGDEPRLRFINGHLTLKVPIAYAGAPIYAIVPEKRLRVKLASVSPDLVVDGVNVYKVTEGEQERVAYKDPMGDFIYDPNEIIGTVEDFADHLEFAMQLYIAFATACYEEKELPIPGDTLIIRSDELVRVEEAREEGRGREAREGEGRLLEEMMLLKKPEVSFADVGGQEKAVAVCHRFAEQLHYPEVFALEGSEPPRGILLWGPPGTGKTLLAKAMANEAEAYFIHVQAADVAGDGLYGQSEKATARIFEEAEKLWKRDGKQVIIYVDEGEMLLPANGGYRHEATAKTVGIFAQAMDGVASSRGITVIISTNEPKEIDPRILSRMDEMEEVPLPSAEGLKQILEIHLAKLVKKAGRKTVSEEIDLKKVAVRAFDQGLSGRDIADAVGILARERGLKQLEKIKEAAGEEGDKADFIKKMAGEITEGKAIGVVLPPIGTEDLLLAVNNSKELLKSKKKGGLGFKGGKLTKE